MDKSFSSVYDLLKDAGSDEDFLNRFKEEADNRQIGDFLFFLRNVAKKSEVELAEKLEITEEEVLSIEYKRDDEITFQELSKYIGALGYRLFSGIILSQKMADETRFLASQISKCFDQIISLCDDDATIKQEVREFVREISTSMNKILSQAEIKLEMAPDPTPTDRPVLALPVPEKPQEEQQPA